MKEECYNYAPMSIGNSQVDIAMCAEQPMLQRKLPPRVFISVDLASQISTRKEYVWANLIFKALFFSALWSAVCFSDRKSDIVTAYLHSLPKSPASKSTFLVCLFMKSVRSFSFYLLLCSLLARQKI